MREQRPRQLLLRREPRLPVRLEVPRHRRPPPAEQVVVERLLLARCPRLERVAALPRRPRHRRRGRRRSVRAERTPVRRRVRHVRPRLAERARGEVVERAVRLPLQLVVLRRLLPATLPVSISIPIPVHVGSQRRAPSAGAPVEGRVLAELVVGHVVGLEARLEEARARVEHTVEARRRPVFWGQLRGRGVRVDGLGRARRVVEPGEVRARALLAAPLEGREGDARRLLFLLLRKLPVRAVADRRRFCPGRSRSSRRAVLEVEGVVLESWALDAAEHVGVVRVVVLELLDPPATPWHACT